MQEMELEDRPGFFGRVKGWFGREEYDVEEAEAEAQVSESRPVGQVATYRLHEARGYSITIRRSIVSFQDAVAAADGVKMGVQQILNLSQCPADAREKIINFMAGVNYNNDGCWEELGENVFLIAPPNARVDVAPVTHASQAVKN